MSTNIFSQSNQLTITLVDCGDMETTRPPETFSFEVKLVNTVKDDFSFNF